MKVLEDLQINTALMDNPAFWDGLNSINLGLFKIDRDGYLVQCNGIAAKILGIDADTDRREMHVSKLDSILSTGLAERIGEIFDRGGFFARRDITCTNARGAYLVLSMCCLPVSCGRTGDESILGVIQDSGDRELRQEDDQGSLQELHVLSTVAAALSSSRALDQILKVILTGATASQGLGFNRAFLFLYDEQSNTLKGHLAVGPASAEEAGDIWQSLDSMRLSLGELLDAEKDESASKRDTISGLISDLRIDLSEASLLSDVCGKGSWANLESANEVDPVTAYFLNRLGTHRSALVPMISKGSLLGLLAADNLITQKPVSDSAVRLLQILANQAAVAMERAKLYEDQIERTAQLERMNALLAESQDQIVKIEKMSIIGQLTAAIAHELRNPLTIIGGFANLMLKAGVTDEQGEYLNIILSETKRSESILGHVLDFSRASDCENCAINFSRLVESSLQLLLGRMKRGNLDITLSLAHQDMTVYGNYDQLSHAFYQFFKVVAEDLVPPGRAGVRTEQKDARAVLLIKISCEPGHRDDLIKALKRIFTETKSSQRLAVLVAGETIRFHGGDFGLAFDSEGTPSLTVELPLSEETRNVGANNSNR